MDNTAVLWAVGVAFALAVLLGPPGIPLLRRLKFGQQVRDDGPSTHLSKQGTPTMGGVLILLAAAVAFVRFADRELSFWALVVACFGFGLVGFLDDYIKIAFRRSLGLTALQKLAGQLFFAVLFCFLLYLDGHPTHLAVPGTEWSLELGWGYWALAVLILLATGNAVNFTDGLDGLLAGTSALAYGAFLVIAMERMHQPASVFAAAMIGAVLGFLVFNAHPAKVFMGDTGSLAIGGGLGAVAVMTGNELLLPVIGGVFAVEMLSVIIQVVSFKTRGKRVFKMSPIHHHFELSGWSEWRVVTTFWFAGLVLAAAGLIWYKGIWAA
ncbi:MAG: phospho-N-acetylmuramoyl-pentapeptide-transferase [Paenibacillaceae bacterium ZCTH02-B3]|nr:MAG: phospho-N-acetylmuramoyl-pentapeptide-transferase [Paenibacillaceae bacterium ZCTH02-B3]